MDVLAGEQLWLIGDTTKKDKKGRAYEIRELKYQLEAEEMLLGAKVIAFYFASSSFSRHFTKELNQFYKSVRQKHHLAFQIIYVSCDYSGDEMNGAIKNHPSWIAVKYNDPLRLRLKEKYGITESHRLPKLVVVEINGRVITYEGRWDVFVVGDAAIDMWLKGQAAVPKWNCDACCLKHKSEVCEIM